VDVTRKTHLDEEGYPIGIFLLGSALSRDRVRFAGPHAKPSVTMIFEPMTGERLFSIQTWHKRRHPPLPNRGPPMPRAGETPLIRGFTI